MALKLNPDKAKLKQAKDATKVAEMLHAVEHDDNWTPNGIRLIFDKVRNKATIGLHNPADANDPIEATEVAGVLLFGKMVMVPPGQNSTATEDIEKRVTMWLRFSNGFPVKGTDGERNPDFLPGVVYPEQFWISPTGIVPYKKIFKLAKETYRVPFSALLIKIKATAAQNKDGSNRWAKPEFEVIRPLTDEEWAYVEPIAAAARARDERRSVDPALDDYEEEATGSRSKPRAPKDSEDDARKEAKQTQRKHEIDEDDEDEAETPAEAPKKRGRPAKAETPAAAAPAKAKKAPVAPAAGDDEDDEDETPAKKPAPVAPDDDDEDETPAPAPAKKAKAAPVPVADDEDDEDEAPAPAPAAKPKKAPVAPVADDEDDED